MPATTDLAIIITGGLAVFGISWWLGNSLENLGSRVTGFAEDASKVVVNTQRPFGDFVAGLQNPEVRERRTNQDALDDFDATEAAKCIASNTSIYAMACPARPQETYYETREVWDEEEGWTYSYPRISPAFKAGQSVLPNWEDRPRGWDAWGLKFPWK